MVKCACLSVGQRTEERLNFNRTIYFVLKVLCNNKKIKYSMLIKKHFFLSLQTKLKLAVLGLD